MQKVVAFLSNKITLRGTEIAMYDYAEFNELLLGNKSIIITRNYHSIQNEWDVNSEAYLKFTERFQVEYYWTQTDIDSIVLRNNITHLYIIKAGGWDGIISTKCINLIHCVFNTNHRHGQVYSVISSEVNRLCNTNYPVVPHMIRNFETTEDLRQELQIPQEAIVFGRYGGVDAFDIDFVYKVIENILKTRTDIYFIFMNTNRFYEHPQIVYVNGTTNMEYKRQFINTSDALLHARFDGETFGITCGEFAVEKKPVITYGGSKERNHINILGDKAVLYADYESLWKIISEFKKDKYNMEFNNYLDYSPENVMTIFNQVFLEK
jgi:hypothetical protein